MDLKMKKNIILLIILNLIFTSWLFSYERPGSTDAAFLLIGVSPRAMAMSDAYISVAEGAEALYYNPAATANFNGTKMIFTHTEWFANINNNFAAITRNYGNIGAFGLMFSNFVTDEMNVRTPLQPEGTGETFFSGSFRLGGTYARRMTDHVSFGASFNYIYSSLYKNLNESAYSTDIAVLYRTNVRNFNFGMKIEHFGSEMKYVDEAYPLPTNFQFGLSFHAFETDQYTLLLSSVAKKPNDGDPVGAFGAEFNWNNLLFLRGGYQLNDAVKTYSLGFGTTMNILGNNYKIDYSLNDYKILGHIHTFGVSVGI